MTEPWNSQTQGLRLKITVLTLVLNWRSQRRLWRKFFHSTRLIRLIMNIHLTLMIQLKAIVQKIFRTGIFLQLWGNIWKMKNVFLSWRSCERRDSRSVHFQSKSKLRNGPSLRNSLSQFSLRFFWVYMKIYISSQYRILIKLMKCRPGIKFLSTISVFFQHHRSLLVPGMS